MKMAQTEPEQAGPEQTGSESKPGAAVDVDLPRRIVLTGFMGAGKTTVGNLLAQRLAWQFLDADTEIESATGATIAQLFQERGEPWFRQLERETIERLLSVDFVVLALGGGAIEEKRTRDLLLTARRTRLIHLEASLETVLERCAGTESIRPVLQDRLNLENRYQRRLPLYRQSHITIPVDALHPSAVVDAILAVLNADPVLNTDSAAQTSR